MKPRGTRVGTAVSGTLLLAFGIALARDQLAAGLVGVALGIGVLRVATLRELDDVLPAHHRYTAAVGYRRWLTTALAAVVVALIGSWLADGSVRGLAFGAVGATLAAPGLGWMVDVWRTRRCATRPAAARATGR